MFVFCFWFVVLCIVKGVLFWLFVFFVYVECGYGDVVIRRVIVFRIARRRFVCFFGVFVYVVVFCVYVW